jgi:hypothetical protein
VLDDDEGHPRLVRQQREQLLEGHEPAGGSADGYDSRWFHADRLEQSDARASHQSVFELGFGGDERIAL